MTDPLAQLRDIHTPSPIGWWPLAPGWYLAALLASLVLLVLIYTGYKLLKRRRIRKQLECILTDITSRYRTNPKSAETIAELAVFLRRLVITYYPENHAAEHGQTWLQTLEAITGNTEYTQGVGQLLITAPYQKNAPQQMNELIDLIKKTTKQITKRKRRVA